MSLWIHLIDPLLPHPVLILCISLGFTSSFNHAFSQMTINILFNSEIEVKTASKDKGKKHHLTKVSCANLFFHHHLKTTNAHKIISRLPSSILKWLVSLMLLFQAWILKAAFTTKLLLLKAASLA